MIATGMTPMGFPPLLAAFVWPTLFFGGAAAVSIPILIHLFARRRFKRIKWAAMEFLLDAERRNRRRVRLEEWLILLLRCLAILLIALLISRPFFQPTGFAAMLGGSDRTERVFVIDDSFSMGCETGDGIVFDRAKEAVTRLVKVLREQSPDDTISILRTSRMSESVATGVYLDVQQTDELFTRLEGLQTSQATLEARDAFDHVRSFLDEQADAVNVAVYIVSDFQRKDWVASISEAEGSAEDEGDSLIASLADWGDDDKGLNLVLVNVGESGVSNVAVTGLETARRRMVADVEADVTVSVTNYSDHTSGVLELDVAMGAGARPTVQADRVQPADTARFSIPITVGQPGYEWVRVATPADVLPVDDQRTLVLETVEAIRVLLVNGEPSSDSFRDEVTLFATAIRPPGEVFSGNELQIIEETDLEEKNLSAFDVVVLANVYRVTESAAKSLSSFVEQGGGLAIFLGDQVDVDAYNDILFAGGTGVLPAPLGDRRTAPQGGSRLHAERDLHPMVRVLAGRDNPFARQIAFDQFYDCTPEDSVEMNLDPEGDDPASQNASHRAQAEVIARFDDADRTPAIVEKTHGLGRVTLITTSCDQEWNDWGKDPSYVIAMLELIQHLSAGGGRATDRLVGGSIEFAFNPEQYVADVLVRTPSYPADQEVAMTASLAEDGRGYLIQWDRTQASGVYHFVQTTLAGEQKIRSVAVNLDPAEGDLSLAGEVDLRRSLKDVPFTYIDGLGGITQVSDEGRRELWRTMLVLAFIVLMCEQMLAWWFGRRG